ncbi:uncharacterized protein LOC125240543 [Leguminivora glycinivorella]|uniref:uncharacterized protein LOC125240543 n=1 Tax=Leguminivora glycinivorella TaxID=1035111 RepID=UPI00200CF99C|nr:uncharacterized protein LOC125240543 [Leguminivora glycinivorella]
MCALVKLKIIFITICLFIHSFCVVETKKMYPKIQDLVSFSEEEKTDFINRIAKNIKPYLDIEQFRSNVMLFRQQIRGNMEDPVVLEGEPLLNRRVMVFKKDKFGAYATATGLQVRTKILDCMLQIVYMAKHYLKLFERKEYVDKTSNAYRIGVIARKLRMMYKKAIRILEILNIRQKKDTWVKYETTAPALTLHHKVAKIHVDFLYFYEVLKRLHYKIRQLSKLPREKPPHKNSPQVW